ncbi:SDR family oxidoreductase [Vibrio fluvialis]|uniref:UDP-glucose 4-epimerase family protein n=1 Tax=Vibrio fluvialis TaxID=676 RepID=UPI000509F193|nr:SDR family oxidoreductase [Vibrio fluvialis]EKO3486887.1 SDR family oxidoreductase [Vibrio fluvialis]MBY7995823.1 SDR family oxidoreductase [Vibrio fluvialis]MBY8103950.1 SDR family oxidoreductase [Vibrio fluvialis]
MKILITGVSGLVGASVARLALARNMEVLGQVRNHVVSDFPTCRKDISADTQWDDALLNVDCVVHCAARVHQMNDRSEEPLAAFRTVNTHGTLNLARQAAAAGVKRFIFVSSIKVNGECTQPNQPFVPLMEHIPADPYGISKYEAEQGLKAIQAQTGLEVVIIRPPLVYGPGVKANFLSMMNWVEKAIPLPLGSVNNRRSLVYLDNLADLILVCCQHPKAAGRTFLVSDNRDVSTSALLQQIARAMNKPSRLISVPTSWLVAAATLIGKKAIAQRVCGNLQLDIAETMHLLDWTPLYSFEEGIQLTVDDYLRSKAAP